MARPKTTRERPEVAEIRIRSLSATRVSTRLQLVRPHKLPMCVTATPWAPVNLRGQRPNLPKTRQEQEWRKTATAAVATGSRRLRSATKARPLRSVNPRKRPTSATATPRDRAQGSNVGFCLKASH
jgi:hypothetical protein